jgi:hypothetical protein
MVTGGTRFRVWGKIGAERKRIRASDHLSAFIVRRSSLVMPSDAEELPRRGEAGHGVVVASMRQEEMRMNSSS